MKSVRIIYLAFSLLIVGCASTETVLAEFDETATFDDYTTFVLCIDDLFVENTQYPQYDNNLVRELLAKEVEKQMIRTGHKTNVLNPQLQAGFQLIVEEKEATFRNCEEQDEYSYWEECTMDTMVYTEETLVLYISDMQRNQIIWQASIPCNMNKATVKLPEYVAGLVQMAFNEYPKVVI